MANVPNLTLNNGVEIPQLGFGTFQIEPENTREAVRSAFEVGYRHIDTAEMYGNEKEVGEAFRDSGLAREDVFITSKLNNGFHASADVATAIDQSLADLQLDPLDRFLFHRPLPGLDVHFVETRTAMEQLYRDGKARAIGVSNFQDNHLRRLHEHTDITPAVNQIEVHPYLAQDPLRAFNAQHSIHTEAWSPIAQGKVLDDPTIVRVAERVHRTPAQVTLRWAIQRGDIVFPKSVTRSRVEENFALFDFQLSEDDITAITSLDRDERTGPDPDTFNMIPG